MTDETRFVLIKPGDVLLIGGVGGISAQDAADMMRRFKDVTGVRGLVLFADEIAIDRLSAADLARLTEENTDDT